MIETCTRELSFLGWLLIHALDALLDVLIKIDQFLHARLEIDYWIVLLERIRYLSLNVVLQGSSTESQPTDIHLPDELSNSVSEWFRDFKMMEIIVGFAYMEKEIFKIIIDLLKFF